MADDRADIPDDTGPSPEPGPGRAPDTGRPHDTGSGGGPSRPDRDVAPGRGGGAGRGDNPGRGKDFGGSPGRGRDSGHGGDSGRGNPSRGGDQRGGGARGGYPPRGQQDRGGDRSGNPSRGGDRDRGGYPPRGDRDRGGDRSGGQPRGDRDRGGSQYRGGDRDRGNDRNRGSSPYRGDDRDRGGDRDRSNDRDRVSGPYRGSDRDRGNDRDRVSGPYRGGDRDRGGSGDRAGRPAHGNRDRDGRRRGARAPAGPPPRRSSPKPPTAADPARQAAFDTLRAITDRDAYANLALPALLRQRRIGGRDAALATELCYGTARAAGLLDVIIDACLDRAPSTVDGAVRDGLRLGAYQLLRTRIPPHAAVSSTVDLVREAAGERLGGFVNAVLRKVSERDETGWVDLLAPEHPVEALALRTAHPGWIARAFGAALGDAGEELAAALRADDERPLVHLTARPGEISADELAAITGGDPARYSPYGVYLDSGDPGDLDPIREHLAHVQDEGSQLCALAVANAELDGPDTRWLDLCAGPGGKAALLGALAATTGATLDAVEHSPRRADLVRDACQGLPVTVHAVDGRDSGLEPGFDRILVDAPCTGLGALRRRPEARWRRSPSDVADLARLQRELVLAAAELLRPGGVLGYVVCTPHLPETVGVLAAVQRARPDLTAVDARPLLPGVPDLGDGPHVQLWPHRHGTDAMFCALLRKESSAG